MVAVFFVEVEQDFGVAVCPEPVSGALEVAPQLAVVVDLPVWTTWIVPSSFAIGWSPVSRSMMESRLAASPTEPFVYSPALSGPRCTSVRLIAAMRSGSTSPLADAIPQIPHMRSSVGAA